MREAQEHRARGAWDLVIFEYEIGKLIDELEFWVLVNEGAK